MNVDKYLAEVEEMEILMEKELTEEEAKQFKLFKKFNRLLEREESMAKFIYNKCVNESSKELI